MTRRLPIPHPGHYRQLTTREVSLCRAAGQWVSRRWHVTTDGAGVVILVAPRQRRASTCATFRCRADLRA